MREAGGEGVGAGVVLPGKVDDVSIGFGDGFEKVYRKIMISERRPRRR